MCDSHCKCDIMHDRLKQPLQQIVNIVFALKSNYI